MNQSNYSEVFKQIDDFMFSHQHLWRVEPFVEDKPSWMSEPEHDALGHDLLSMSEALWLDLEDESKLVNWLSLYLPGLKDISKWQISAFDGTIKSMAKFADVGMPGRKKQQIIGFCSALSAYVDTKAPFSLLDWCSGKGHLAKQLHYVFAQSVTCMEYDKNLCRAGEQDSQKLGFAINFVAQDVLKPISPKLLAQGQWHTALHACGELHMSMLKQVAPLGAGIAVSPCCYHLINTEHYQGLSVQAQSSALKLDKQDLRLAVLQTVTGGARVKRLRQQELIWRIGFDLWRRQITGVNRYQPLASIQKHWLSGLFVDFCRSMAKGLNLPWDDNFAAEHWLGLAELKYARVKRLEKVRLGFRPLMELWLLLDRVLYLQHQGYDCQLVTFCDVSITPRNALILAHHK